MNEPIPGVEGGTRLACDGCGQHNGPKDDASPTGTELVTSLTFMETFQIGDWHQTCFKQGVMGGWVSHFEDLIHVAENLRAKQEGRPTMEEMAQYAIDDMKRNYPFGMPLQVQLLHRVSGHDAVIAGKPFPAHVPSKAYKSPDDILKEIGPTEKYEGLVMEAIQKTLSYVPDWGPLLLFAVRVRDMGPQQEYGESGPGVWPVWISEVQVEAKAVLTKIGVSSPINRKS